VYVVGIVSGFEPKSKYQKYSALPSGQTYSRGIQRAI